MKNFAIIRVEKLKSFAAISASAQHCFRERETPNADPAVKNQTVGAAGSENVIARIRERISSVDKHDKQAVLCLEYVVAASTSQSDQYFVDSLEFLKRKHGTENVVSATIHNDEQTRHMSVYVVPVVQVAETTRKRSVNKKGGGREVKTEVVPAHTLLSAKHFTGGREVLSQLQSDFAFQVGAKHGLERGVKRGIGSERVTRTSVKEWYAKKDEILAEYQSKVDDLMTYSEKISQKSADFEREHAAFTEQAAVVKQHLSELQQKEREIVSMSTKLQETSTIQDEKFRILRDAEALMQSEKKDLAKRESALNTKSQQIQTLEGTLNERAGRISQQQQQIVIQQQQLDSERVSVESRAAAVTTAEKQLTERESAVNRRERALSVVSDSLQQRETAVIDRESAVDRRERAVTAAAESVKQQQQQLDTERAEVVTIKQRLNELLDKARKKIKLFSDAFDALSDHQKVAVVKAEPAVAEVVLKKKSKGVSM